MAKTTATDAAPTAEKKTATDAAPTAETDQPINHNKEYHEYRIDVEPFMKKNGRDGDTLSHYIGEVLKKVKTVRIEPFRAEQLNRTWHTRKVIYIAADQPKPGKIKRQLSDEEGKEWEDKVIELYKD